jgi:hypothetical protein
MNTHINIHERLRRHERDVALFGRLFADWSRGRAGRDAEAHQRLDGIEAQLARLELSVRMTESSCRPAIRTQGPGPSRAAVFLTVQQS